MNWTVKRVDRSYRLESSIEENWPQPYKVEVKYGYDYHSEMIRWCNERFGEHTKQWNNPRWSSNTGHNTFWFKNARDRTMFLMRWS